MLRRNLDHSDAQHTAVVDAILAGDPAGARAAMEEHCDATAELVRGLLGSPDNGLLVGHTDEGVRAC